MRFTLQYIWMQILLVCAGKSSNPGIHDLSRVQRRFYSRIWVALQNGSKRLSLLSLNDRQTRRYEAIDSRVENVIAGLVIEEL